MATYLYKPGHPYANERGFVTKDDFYTHKFYTEPDLRMHRGNEPVTIHYISDEMPPTRHMATPDGKLYTSKKKFRDETKARGCIEVGNDVAPLMKQKQYTPPTNKRERREAIRGAIRDLKENRIPEGELATIKRTAEIANYQARNRKRLAR